MAEGYVGSRCLHVIASLGVCDVLADVPLRLTDIAREVGADPPSLGRVMRHLASVGIFEMTDGSFRHNEASRLLTPDHPGGSHPAGSKTYDEGMTAMTLRRVER